MKQKILHTLLFWLILLPLQQLAAQEPQPGEEGWFPGRYPSGAIDVYIGDTPFEFVDSVNTFEWCYHKFYPETVHYKLHLSGPMTTVCIYTLGSELKYTNVRLRLISECDTIDIPTSTNRIIDYFQTSDAWTPECHYMQDYLIQTLQPGEYFLEISGVYSQTFGTSNGGLVTSIIGYQGLPVEFMSIPEHMQMGMLAHPFEFGLLPSNRNGSILVNKELTQSYLDPRRNFDGNVYYSFSLTDSLDVSLNTEESSSALRLFPENHPTDTLMAVSGNSIATRRLGPGTFILAATDTSGITIGATLNFRIESSLPPPPPFWMDHIHYDPAVAGHNYLTERTMLTPDGSRFADVTQHHDGLGRPTLRLQVDASPQGGDIASLTEYDLSGRDYRNWLPTVTQGGYHRGHLIDFSAPYGGDRAPYSETRFDGTPLNRPEAETGPGERWHYGDIAVTHAYGLNPSGSPELSAFCYTASDTPDRPDDPVIISCSGRYQPGEMQYHSLTDEDGNTLIEFTDARDQKILQRSIIGDGSFADTYYIYDTRGNLTAVLSPEASARMAYVGSWNADTESALKDFAYIYRYNVRGLMTYKRLPGCEPVTYRYDSTNRIILTQDGNMRSRGIWSFELADVFGRPCLTGTCSDMTFEFRQGTARARRSDDSSALMGYVVEGATLVEPTVLSATYYDDYSVIGQPFFSPGPIVNYQEAAEFGERFPNVRGQVTATATAIPVEAGVDSLTYLYSATYYDSHDRAIQTVSTNHLGSTDRTFVSYDFAGRPLLTESVHTVGSRYADSAIVQQVRRTFDDFGRELTVSHRLGREGEWIELAANTYDAVGRLIATDRGSSSELRTDFTLDIRSRLSEITSDNYRQSLDFTPAGNVSRMRWWAHGIDETERQYDYTYDALGRLIAADYTDRRGGTGNFSTAYSYDLNGNILTLRRSGLYNVMSARPYRLVDDLTMAYSGNRLITVSDAVFGPYDQGSHHFVDRADETVELTYDANGNTISDLNHELLTTIYDWNNQPRLMQFADGSTAAYLYDAAGVRHRVRHRVAEFPLAAPFFPDTEPDDEGFFTITTDYVGPMLYENSRLSQIFIDGGYIRLIDDCGQPLATPEYHFFLRDHLGNNRLDASVKNDTNGLLAVTINQAVHYYPFGLPMDCSHFPDYQRWLFGDKEFDRTHGLDLYDQAARQYDPILGRFRRPDPLAEKYHPLSPYLFCAANPLRNIDPTGSIIQATDLEMQNAIRMTLRKEDRQYVEFDKTGVLNNSILSQCNSDSQNYKDLLFLSASEITTIVNLDDKYEFRDENGTIQNKTMMEIEYDEYFKDDDPIAPLNITTGEMGEAGIALLPGNGTSGRNSTDENINIVIHKDLSELGRAESFAHEAYGHAFLYIATGGNRDKAGHKTDGLRETNSLLIDKLNNAIKETIINNR